MREYRMEWREGVEIKVKIKVKFKVKVEPRSDASDHRGRLR
jgi:hypothetical protein